MAPGVQISDRDHASRDLAALSDIPRQQAQLTYSVSSGLVDEHYLKVLGVKLTQGRPFSGTEAREQRPLIIINQRFASQ